MRDADVDSFGIEIGGQKISNLRYTHDTALCAEDICQLLHNINEEGKLKNMKLNAKKTKIMYVGKGEYSDIEIDGQILERVFDFIYLGSTKTHTGNLLRHTRLNRQTDRQVGRQIEKHNKKSYS